jgi:hypothetical protein
MHRKPELPCRGLMDQLGGGKATSGEALWSVELRSPGATATTIRNQTP